MKPKTVYIEITSLCNLNCIMCSRNNWENETTGNMDINTFYKIIDELPKSVEKVFFSGIGEPLIHPNIIEMIRYIKQFNIKCELISNGTMLDRKMSKELIDAGLDILWISLDSLEEKNYEEIRKGAKYSGVIKNIKIFNTLQNPKISLALKWNNKKQTSVTQLGISFVIMKSNLKEFGKLVSKAHSMNISYIKATHLLPYSEDMINEICYDRIINLSLHSDKSLKIVNVDLPLIDSVETNFQYFTELFSLVGTGFQFMGLPIHRKEGYCRFIEEDTIFIRWDGEVSPCMALLHDNIIFQQGKKRFTHFCSFGNIKEKSLISIWEENTYSDFREKVKNFNFSPCTKCVSCSMFENNEDDCIGSSFPSCGACLWAQGLIQCP